MTIYSHEFINIYFVISTIFVLAAVMNIAFSTLPNLKSKDEKNSTLEQYKEYNRTTHQQQQPNQEIGDDYDVEDDYGQCSLQEALQYNCRRFNCFSSYPELHQSADLQTCTNYIDKLVDNCYYEYLHLINKQKVCKLLLPRNKFCRLCYGTIFLDPSYPGYNARKCDLLITNMINKTCITNSPKPTKKMPCMPSEIKLKLCYKKCIFETSPEDSLKCADVRFDLGELCFYDHMSKEYSRLDCIYNGDDDIDCDSCYVSDYIDSSIDRDLKTHCKKQLHYFQTLCVDKTSKTTQIYTPNESTTFKQLVEIGQCQGIDFYKAFKLCLIKPPAFKQTADIEICSNRLINVQRFCTNKDMFEKTVITEHEYRTCSQLDCFVAFYDVSYRPEYYNLTHKSKCANSFEVLAFECYHHMSSSLTEETRQKENLNKPERNESKLLDNSFSMDITGYNGLLNVTSTTDYNVTLSGEMKSDNFLDFHLNKKAKFIPKDILPVSPIDKLNALTDTIEVINVFLYTEFAVNIFFTLDLVLRCITCPSYKYFFTSFLNLCDILALLSFYEKYLSNLFRFKSQDIFIYLQMVRIFRLFRVTKNIPAFKILEYSLRQACKDMLIMSLYLFIAIMIFSNFIYFFEDETEIPSIPAAWWWCIITMTTVGYGDMYPKTIFGKIIGVLCAISGVVLFSMIIPVIVQTFLSLYQYLPLVNSAKNERSHTSTNMINIEHIGDREVMTNESRQRENTEKDCSQVELNEIKVNVIQPENETKLNNKNNS
ncbi:hypothetical protein KUTeg_017310 [Tegillarca granosa]|uniref:Ion transport domain-containing protein n=1 Tax=Tegillarca granosa TaxID=220873 RepID=A0ABQ9EIN9_TEGGR|nr:hypothetical protein KUTeg_017310 [Tegillarca granosa]